MQECKVQVVIYAHDGWGGGEVWMFGLDKRMSVCTMYNVQCLTRHERGKFARLQKYRHPNVDPKNYHLPRPFTKSSKPLDATSPYTCTLHTAEH